MNNTRTYITKSGYMTGLKCDLAYFNWWHKIEGERSEQSITVMQAGTDVGKLAQLLIPNGIDLNDEQDQSPWKLADKTAGLVREGLPIFEATFITNKEPKLLCKVDMLVPDSDGWMIWEVKATNSVKEEHIPDLAFQYYVLSMLGLKINRAAIVHLNKDYLRFGELDIKQLFTVDDQTEIVKSMQPEIQGNIQECWRTGRLEKAPQVPIGSHCTNPYECPFTYMCWKDFPERDSLYVIPRLGSKAEPLLEQGLYKLEDIDPASLSEKQRLIWDAHINNKPVIDAESIKSFIDGLEYPLHFLDFETIMPDIPIWDGTHTYQQIPFQYSLHIIRQPGAEPEHYEFLDEANGDDPRPGFIKSLINDLLPEGTILAYNQGFETGRLKELATSYPAYGNAIESVIARVQDLLTPFRSQWYYHPDMQGSASIKQVLPVLVPELSYKDMKIGEGGAAMEQFFRLLTQEVDSIEKAEVMANLKAYCKLDTWAMVRILEKLREF